MSLLLVKDLSVDRIDKFQKIKRRLVDDLNFEIGEGETFCLIGESGCGKSLTALGLTRLLDPNTFQLEGKIHFDGTEIISSPESELRKIRGAKVSYVFQDPFAHWNPVMRIGDQILEMLSLHKPEKANPERVIELLEMVGMMNAKRRAKDYPHQMSGGMLQRAMIAMALASEPKLLIADEPTTALDVTLQAQILELLALLQKKFSMAVLLISHNLGLVREFGEQLAVMYAGQIVEMGGGGQVLSDPKHPYTSALISAVPHLGKRQDPLPVIEGSAPIGKMPKGCRFHPRCVFSNVNCTTDHPDMIEVSKGHWARCPVFNPYESARCQAT